MVRACFVGALLAAARATSATSSATSATSATSAVRHVPGAYIIEYADVQDHAEVIGSLEGARIRRKLDFRLYKGVAVQFDDLAAVDERVARIAGSRAVRSVRPIRTYALPQHTVHSTGGLQHAAMTRAGNDSADTFSPHVLTQVDKLRDAGVRGDGIKIAVVDTGIDYSHPALGGGFGPGHLVSFGTDLVGDAFDGSSVPEPDDDPIDHCNGHGTHVAGIIAAQAGANPHGIVGAATGVTLGAYRVFGCKGEVPDDILIAAYNMAFEAGADIITASIGGSSGWPEEAWSVAVQRIVAAGVPCILAAGNSGQLGLFDASTAGQARGAVDIASADNSVSPALLHEASYGKDGKGGNDSSLVYLAGKPAAWVNASLPVYAPGPDDAHADGCTAYPDHTPDLSGSVVLLRRGNCTFEHKARLAAERGATHLLFYNNRADGMVKVTVDDVPGIVAVGMITADDGATMTTRLRAGDTLVARMADPDTTSAVLVNFPNKLSAGLLSAFTSWGPTYELDVKPQFAAPGGMITGLFPVALGSYAVLSGTSMACPLAAGVYALLMQARGTKDPATLARLLSATAAPARFSDGETVPAQSGPLAPVAQQGAGMLRAYDAAHASVLLSVSSLAFNDSQHLAASQNFSITNLGHGELTFSLTHVGAATAYTFSGRDDPVPAAFPNELVDSHATLLLANGSDSVVVPANGTVAVVVQLTAPPPGLDVDRLPVYSGYVALHGSDGSSYRLPYLGVSGSMRSTVVLDSRANRTFVASSLASPPVPVAANTTFSLPPAGHVNDTAFLNTALPSLHASLAFGSSKVEMRVLDAAGNLIGHLPDSPQLYRPRGVLATSWDGRLQGGKYVPAGAYALLVRALRVFGDEAEEKDWDVVHTPVFGLRYLDKAT